MGFRWVLLDSREDEMRKRCLEPLPRKGQRGRFERSCSCLLAEEWCSNATRWCKSNIKWVTVWIGPLLLLFFDNGKAEHIWMETAKTSSQVSQVRRHRNGCLEQRFQSKRDRNDYDNGTWSFFNHSYLWSKVSFESELDSFRVRYCDNEVNERFDSKLFRIRERKKWWCKRSKFRLSFEFLWWWPSPVVKSLHWNH